MDTREKAPVNPSTGTKCKKGVEDQVENEARTAAYVRVSTTSQNEAGQRAEVERWLSGNGINTKDVQWYVDKQSGDNLQRPAFEKLQQAVFAGEIGTVVVYKLDRLSRNLRDGINTLGKWCEQSIRVVSTSQQLDFNGTVGQLIASVLFAVAQMEKSLYLVQLAVAETETVSAENPIEPAGMVKSHVVVLAQLID